MSVVMMRYHIAEFRRSPLSQAFLARLSEDFSAARESGFKINLRFAYNYPMGGPDASLDQVIAHLEQLAPAFRQNVDVIALLDLGFIGCWGEMHTSSNLLVARDSRNLNASTHAIIAKAFEVLPKERMIAVRYPAFKLEYFGGGKEHLPVAPVTSQEAFHGSVKARWGHHDDCPVCGEWNAGTYWSHRKNAGEIKEFLSRDNLYVVQSWEPGDPGTVATRTDEDGDGFILGNHESCARMVPLFARMRWSLLNSSYNPGSPASYDRWKRDGCFETIRKNLGYRFRLERATLPDSVRSGDILSVGMTLSNVGWARPFNPRRAELVHRMEGSGIIHRMPATDQDVRLWLPGPGETRTVTVTGMLPPGMWEGTYSVLFNLPDPMESLKDRPEYSIRLASQGVWEQATGFNSLSHRLRVLPRTVAISIPGKKIARKKSPGRAVRVIDALGRLRGFSRIP